MRECKTGRHIILFFALFIVIIVLQSFLAAEEADRQVDYSGKTIHKALLEMAKLGKFNVITALPPVKIEKLILRCSGDGCWEEMVNLLGQVIPFRMTKIANVFLLHSDEQEEQCKKEQFKIIRKTLRNKLELFDLYRKAFPLAKKFFSPEGNLIFLAGRSPERSDFEMFQYSHDLICRSLRISCNVEKKPESIMIASFSFYAQGNQPFKFAIVPQTPSEWSFSGEGIGDITFDEEATLKTNLHFSNKSSSESIQLEHSLFIKDHPLKLHMGTQCVGLASGEFIIKWGVEHVSSGFIKAAPATFPMISLNERESIGDAKEEECNVSDSSLIPSGFAYFETPITSILESIIASEGEKLLCDDVVSGTVTLICYGESIPFYSLVQAIAASRDFEASHEGGTWLVGLPKAISGMRGYYLKPFVSPDLKEVSVEKASKIINDIMASLGFDGKAMFDTGQKHIIVKGEDRAVYAAVSALEILERRPLMFDVGGLFRAPYGEIANKKSLDEASQLNMYKNFKNGSGVIRVTPVNIDEDARTLRGFEYIIQSINKSYGKVMMKASANIPADPRQPVVSFDGANGFRFYVTGNIATYSFNLPCPASTSEGFDSASATAFDDSF
ncbi:MAG: hypothetical protein HQM09_11270 [Candidatus Riflebacteria bacterium]|nr:hypothetical protein [Candidatus Riflebacteria bacterium]